LLWASVGALIENYYPTLPYNHKCIIWRGVFKSHLPWTFNIEHSFGQFAVWIHLCESAFGRAEAVEVLGNGIQ
jgi:hypothetical protein